MHRRRTVVRLQSVGEARRSSCNRRRAIVGPLCRVCSVAIVSKINRAAASLSRLIGRRTFRRRRWRRHRAFADKGRHGKCGNVAHHLAGRVLALLLLLLLLLLRGAVHGDGQRVRRRGTRHNAC